MLAVAGPVAVVAFALWQGLGARWLLVAAAAVGVLGVLVELRRRIALDAEGVLHETRAVRTTSVRLDHLVAARAEADPRGPVLHLRDRGGGALALRPARWQDGAGVVAAVAAGAERSGVAVQDGWLVGMGDRPQPDRRAAPPPAAVSPWGPALPPPVATAGDGSGPGPAPAGQGPPAPMTLRPTPRARAVTIAVGLVFGVVGTGLALAFGGAMLLFARIDGSAGPFGAVPVLLAACFVVLGLTLAVGSARARLQVDDRGCLSVRSIPPWRRRSVDLSRLRSVAGRLALPTRSSQRRDAEPALLLRLTDDDDRAVTLNIDDWAGAARLCALVEWWAHATGVPLNTATTRFLRDGTPPGTGAWSDE